MIQLESRSYSTREADRSFRFFPQQEYHTRVYAITSTNLAVRKKACGLEKTLFATLRCMLGAQNAGSRHSRIEAGLKALMARLYKSILRTFVWNRNLPLV